jgi:ElaB/YqjD/DUF883 family membrane-anchored ribosome-binding protein
MADQRGFGNADKSPAEGGTQVRDRSQEGGTQGRDRTQESGAQGRDRAQEAGAQGHDSDQEAGAQVRDKTQEMGRQGAATASDSSQQGRQQAQAVEHTLEDAIRAKPLQSTFMAAGLGMFVTLLWKKEETASDYARQGRQQAEDYYRQGRQQAEDYYRQGRRQVAAVENTLEDAMRAKPLQSLLIAAGCGMVLTLLLKK